MPRTLSSISWRGLFVLGGVLVSIGGPQHPGGTMLEMLRDPAWFRSHALIFVGFLCWTIGLWIFRRGRRATDRVDRWLRIGIALTALQTADMALHTMAFVDADALAAGASTTVLDLHLLATAVIYPVYAAGTIGLIFVGQRARALGSPWIGWLGIAGAAAHGTAGLLVAGFDVGWARVLFPFILLLAIWYILAGVWPAGRTAVAPAELDAEPS